MYIKLSAPPAFGFQIKKCYAGDYYEKNINNKKDAYLQSSKGMFLSNVAKVLGYMPVIGQLIGVGRVIIALKDNDKNKVNQIARGVLEIAGAGLLLFAIDVGVTLSRYYRAKSIKSNAF